MNGIKFLEFLFIFILISEILFLFIYSLFFIYYGYSLWSTFPSVFLSGLSAVYNKTMIHYIAFLIINLAPCIIMLCNIFKFDYFYGKDFNTRINITFNEKKELLILRLVLLHDKLLMMMN
jgi:hypothetical protein